MEVLIVSVTAFVANLPLGMWRSRYKRLSLRWWLLIHASIPLIVALRIWLGTHHLFIPLFIALAVAGQLLGARFLGKKADVSSE